MYSYETDRPWVFTDEGQRQFLRIRDKVFGLLAKAGAVRLQEVMANESGSTWLIVACVDRMAEIGELKEISLPSSGPGQHRVFISAKNDA